MKRLLKSGKMWKGLEKQIQMATSYIRVEHFHDQKLTVTLVIRKSWMRHRLPEFHKLTN